MTKFDYDRRNKAYPLMKKAFDEGKKVAFRRGKLIVNGSVVELPD